MTIITQIVAPFAHIYPLPLHAMGVRNDLPFEHPHAANYSRCESIVTAQVTDIAHPANGNLDLTIEIIEGDCERAISLCGGNSIFYTIFLAPGPHQMLNAENLMQLYLAVGISLKKISGPRDIMRKPFLMSIAVPCQ